MPGSTDPTNCRPPGCPLCALSLETGGRQTWQCTNCFGLFVPRASMAMVLSALRGGHNLESALDPYRGTVSTEPAASRKAGYRQCPECDGIMNRTELIGGSRIVVDMCIVDGVWFDSGELSQAALYMAQSRQFDGDKGELAGHEALADALGRFFQ